jgi:hypothetical protein
VTGRDWLAVALGVVVALMLVTGWALFAWAWFTGG